MQIPVRLEALEDGGNWGNRERTGERGMDTTYKCTAYSVQEKISVSI